MAILDINGRAFLRDETTLYQTKQVPKVYFRIGIYKNSTTSKKSIRLWLLNQ